MRKLLVLTAAAVLGCGDPASPTDGIIVSTSLRPNPTMRVGATISISLQIQNRSDEARDLEVTECFPPFEVLSQSGAVVGPAPRACTLALRPPTPLGPGVSMDYTSTWDGDSNAQSSSGQAIPPPPGSYFIRPRVMVVGAGYVYGSVVSITITP